MWEMFFSAQFFVVFFSGIDGRKKSLMFDIW